MKYIKKSIHRIPALLSGAAAALALIFTGCADDSFSNMGGAGEGSMTEATLQLDVDVPLGDSRTRAADELGNTDVNSLWVGVYDVQTGNRVGSKFFSSPGQTVNLPVIYYDAHPQVAIVGVANYEGASSFENEPLESLLEGAETWNDLVGINVALPASVQTGEPQVMMGLLSSDGKRAFFKTNANGGVAVDNCPTYSVNLTSSQYGAMIKNITGKRIYLNRLYSQVNVNVATGEDAEVTAVSYRRCNMPTATYLAERPTYTGTVKTWNTFVAGTPNFADTKMTPANTPDTGAPCYVSDGEDAWTPANGNSFTFAHLDNKHWRSPEVRDADLEGHDKREAFSTTEAYKGKKILNGLGHAYNNYASYFVVKMTVFDKKKNQSAEVEYTIHEGNINDTNGDMISSEQKNGDYSAFRNTIYNYNITVNGIGYITYNVTQSEAHHDGVSGTIWDTERSTATELRGSITVTPNNASVFRFYVARGEESPLDFISGSTEGMNGVYWPAITSNTAFDQIPGDISDSFSFIKDGATMNMAQFLEDARQTGGTYTVVFNPENPEKRRIDPSAYKLGVYFYNPTEGGNPTVDSDGCTVHTGKKFHVVEWLPPLPIRLQPLDVANRSTKRFINNNLSIDLKAAVEASANYSLEYNKDYKYVLTIDGKDYDLTAPDFKFTMPISQLVDSDTYPYTVTAKVLDNEEYYDSYPSTANVTFGYPNWDFTGSSWVNAYKTWGGGDGKNYTQFTGMTKENIVDKLSIEAGSGKNVRGYYSGNSPYLNLQNSGRTCAIYFTVFQNCNISITGTGGDGRKLIVENGDVQESQDVPGTFNYKTTVKLNEGEGSRTIRIYSGSSSISFKKIDLTVLK